VTFAQRNKGRLRLALASAALLLTPLIARSAGAQMGPGGGSFGSPGGGMQPPPQQGGEKEEGPAEEAPEESHPADLEPLTSYPEQNKRKMQIFELDGYLRFRDDYIHDFFLGLGYSNVASGSVVPGTTTYGLPPFPLPLDCPSPASTSVKISPAIAGSPGANCPVSNMGGANLRFRLEPTLNVGSSRRHKTRRRSGRTATPPASAPSAPGPRSTPSSARSTSAACPGTGGAASSTTTATAPTATWGRRSTG
jgi:hypothetical protein